VDNKKQLIKFEYITDIGTILLNINFIVRLSFGLYVIIVTSTFLLYKIIKINLLL